jgi:hypothetical protein
MFTPRFASLMWLHVLGCALVAVASVVTARSLGAEGSPDMPS